MCRFTFLNGIPNSANSLNHWSEKNPSLNFDVPNMVWFDMPNMVCFRIYIVCWVYLTWFQIFRAFHTWANSLNHWSEKITVYILMCLIDSLGHVLSEYIWFVGSISYKFLFSDLFPHGRFRSLIGRKSPNLIFDVPKSFLGSCLFRIYMVC